MEAEMRNLNDPEWEQLARDLSTRVAAVAPEWTDRVDNDPGITLVELFGFLAESVLARPGVSPEARTRLRSVVTLLQGPTVSICADLPTPSRVGYFAGQLLSPADLEDEQSYFRNKHRRHNLVLHGTGIVSGLDVTVEPQQNGEPLAVVSAGVAIGPDGEELVICDRLTSKVSPGLSSAYVTLYLAEHAGAMQVGGQASRIEEVAEAAVRSDVPSGHLALARLKRVNGSWVADGTFKPARPRGLR
jgi:hypothetical protein